jgi:ribulose-5-phosphate 4-epimerase/fuculose-1-phosphate aldolase
MAIDEATYKPFWKVGKDLSDRGLETSHRENISISSGGKICIKRRSSMLGWLEPEDLVECH